MSRRVALVRETAWWGESYYQCPECEECVPYELRTLSDGRWWHYCREVEEED